MLEIAVPSINEEFRPYEVEGYSAFAERKVFDCPYTGIAMFYWIHGWCKAEIDAGINIKAEGRISV